jgi:hypothetical protein
MTITTTITWSELIGQYDDEREQYEQARAEIGEVAAEEYGDDWREQSVPSDPDLLDPEERDLYVYHLQDAQLRNSIQSCDKRQNVLETIQDHYGDGEFEVRMLTGQETMDIETDLRMAAQREGVDVDALEVRRKGNVVDRATVAAPEGIPTDDSGSPVPSDAEDALTQSLWEMVNRFNSTGSVDFQTADRGDTAAPSPTAAPSATPTPSTESPTPSDSNADE